MLPEAQLNLLLDRVRCMTSGWLVVRTAGARRAARGHLRVRVRVEKSAASGAANGKAPPGQGGSGSGAMDCAPVGAGTGRRISLTYKAMLPGLHSQMTKVVPAPESANADDDGEGAQKMAPPQAGQAAPAEQLDDHAQAHSKHHHRRHHHKHGGGHHHKHKLTKMMRSTVSEQEGSAGSREEEARADGGGAGNDHDTGSGEDKATREASEGTQHVDRDPGVSVAGQKLGFASASDEGAEDDDDGKDEDIPPPYALAKRTRRGILVRVRALGCSLLTNPVYPAVLYGACLVDAGLLWLDGSLSPGLTLPMHIGIDLIFWAEFCLKVSSFGLIGNSSTTIHVHEQGAEVARVVDTYLAQRWYVSLLHPYASNPSPGEAMRLRMMDDGSWIASIRRRRVCRPQDVPARSGCLVLRARAFWGCRWRLATDQDLGAWATRSPRAAPPAHDARVLGVLCAGRMGLLWSRVSRVLL